MTAKNHGTQNKSKFPGPGQYNIDKLESTNLKQPVWKIGTSKRNDELKQKLRENYPGPGNYSLTKTDCIGPKYSFGHNQRFYNNASTFNPGPGQYKIPTTIFNVPNFSLGNWDSNYRFV